jgi:hypothetical protein
MSSRACTSTNHSKDADKSLRRGSASCWKCPRCKKWFCSACEGTDNGYKTCDACWAFIERRRGKDYDVAHPPKAFAILVRKYVYRNRWKEVFEYS